MVDYASPAMMDSTPGAGLMRVPDAALTMNAGADEPPSDSSMIALIPMTNDWCQIECPHMTLVYSGPIKDLPSTAFNELAKDAASLAMMSRPLQLKVMGVEIFGEGADAVDVLKLLPSPELWAMRRYVEKWNKSEYKQFKPHCTIGPPGSRIKMGYMPRALAFDRVLVGWGDEKMTFNMRP